MGHSVSYQNNSKKPLILFNQPKYARKVKKKLFPGAQKDCSCWNCGLLGHRLAKCRKPINPTAIAARKAAFMEKKYGKHAPKRTLYETAQGIAELLDIDINTNDDNAAETYFGDAFEILSSSEESMDGIDNEEGEKLISFTPNFRTDQSNQSQESDESDF